MSMVSESKARLSPVAGQAGLTALDYGARAVAWLKDAFNSLPAAKPGPSPLLSFHSTPTVIDNAGELDEYAQESVPPFAVDYALSPKETAPEKPETLPYTPSQLAAAQRAAAHEIEYRRDVVWGDVSFMGREKDIKPKANPASQSMASTLDEKTYGSLRRHI